MSSYRSPGFVVFRKFQESIVLRLNVFPFCGRQPATKRGLGICRTLHFAPDQNFRSEADVPKSLPCSYRQIPSKKMKLRFETNCHIFSWLSKNLTVEV